VFNFAKSLQIGNLMVPNRVFLAPLAGVSDIPMRRICQQMGAGLTYVEMLSATAIKYRNKRTFEMMQRHKNENILGVQITAPNALQMAEAIKIVSEECPSGFETIDINMGCPVKKVVGAGCGSAILKDPNRVKETVQLSKSSIENLSEHLSCVNGSLKKNIPLSSKIRLGYTRENVNVGEVSEKIVNAGAQMLTIHGRTRSEGYSTPVDLEGILKGVQAARQISGSNIVLVGNGDVFDSESAQTMVASTGVDAVMVSRGALGNPWVFKEILNAKTEQPTLAEWYEVVLEHIHLHTEFYGKERNSAILLRKHLLWYSKGFPHMRSLRESFNSVEKISDALDLLDSYKSKSPHHFKRFDSGSQTEWNEQRKDYDPKYEMDRKLDRGVGDLNMTSEQNLNE
jgi:tRNA-dihydrouridine synthase B